MGCGSYGLVTAGPYSRGGNQSLVLQATRPSSWGCPPTHSTVQNRLWERCSSVTDRNRVLIVLLKEDRPLCE